MWSPFWEANVKTQDPDLVILQKIKRQLDHVVASGLPLAEQDVGAVSIFYAWWSLEFNDADAMKMAHRLREIAAFWSLTSVPTPSLVQTALANHFFLKIWEEIGQPSPIWLRGLPLARRKLKKTTADVLRRPRAYELFCGAAGLALVGLQIDDREVVSRCLSYLESTLQPTPYGLAYYATPAFIDSDHVMPGRTRRFSPGLAHGLAGPLLLSKYTSFIKEFENSSRRIVGALSKSLTAMMESHEKPLAVYPADHWTQSLPTSANWCIGFAGIGFALKAPAHLATGDRAIVSRSQQLGCKLLAQAQESDSLSQLKDSHVCHGQAGTSQVFLRSELATLDFNEATTLPLESPLTLLGSLGIAFTLLSKRSAYDLPWDRMFLLSPPRMKSARRLNF